MQIYQRKKTERGKHKREDVLCKLENGKKWMKELEARRNKLKMVYIIK